MVRMCVYISLPRFFRRLLVLHRVVSLLSVWHDMQKGKQSREKNHGKDIRQNGYHLYFAEAEVFKEQHAMLWKGREIMMMVK